MAQCIFYEASTPCLEVSAYTSTLQERNASFMAASAAGCKPEQLNEGCSATWRPGLLTTLTGAQQKSIQLMQVQACAHHHTRGGIVVFASHGRHRKAEAQCPTLA
eukprot:1156863-Pelagomonas_calceolata.AAC.4